MRNLTFFLFFVLTFPVVHAQIDIQHYRFALELTDASDTIYGKTTVRLRPLKNLKNFDLDLKNAGGKGMIVTGVILEKSGTNLLFDHQNDKLTIHLEDSLKLTEEISFTVDYKGIPADGLIIAQNKFGDRTFFADNWPNRAHHWLPVNDHPADKASFEFVVIAPALYDVISNGTRVEERLLDEKRKITHWREEIPLSTKIMVIGVAKCAVKKYDDSPRGIPVSAWVYPQDSSKGFHDFAVAPAMLKFFVEYIGPYAFDKLANVQSKTIFGGMENASAIFYDEKAITGRRTNEATVAHEIVHQWFGNMASEKSFAHLWLSEGFATYLTNIYYEKTYGLSAMQERLKNDRRRVIGFAAENKNPVVDTSSALMDLLNANSYQKGGWVLHMLCQEVGDLVFREIIQAYYDQYKGSNADTRDFQRLAEAVSGKDLNWFFDQWLYRGGVPQLSLTWKVNGNAITAEVVQKTEAPYKLPLEIGIVTADGRTEIQEVIIEQKVTSLSFNTTSKPVKLVPDPGVKLLFEEVK